MEPSGTPHNKWADEEEKFPIRLRDCITGQKNGLNGFKKSFLEHFWIKLMNKIHFAQSPF